MNDEENEFGWEASSAPYYAPKYSADFLQQSPTAAPEFVSVGFGKDGTRPTSYEIGKAAKSHALAPTNRMRRMKSHADFLLQSQDSGGNDEQKTGDGFY